MCSISTWTLIKDIFQSACFKCVRQFDHPPGYTVTTQNILWVYPEIENYFYNIGNKNKGSDCVFTQ